MANVQLSTTHACNNPSSVKCSLANNVFVAHARIGVSHLEARDCHAPTRIPSCVFCPRETRCNTLGRCIEDYLHGPSSASLYLGSITFFQFMLAASLSIDTSILFVLLLIVNSIDGASSYILAMSDFFLMSSFL